MDPVTKDFKFEYTDTYRLTHYLSPLEHRQMILQAGKLYKTDKKKDDFFQLSFTELSQMEFTDLQLRWFL